VSIGSFAIVLSVTATVPLGAAAGGGPCASPPRPGGLATATVRRVVDGDTVIVRRRGRRAETVRLIGIDSPELHDSDKLTRDATRTGRAPAAIQALGRRAAAATANLLPRGRRVGLELDAEQRDREGRLLAYVWRDDGTLVNLAIVDAGYASLLTIPPNVRHAERFRACLQAARAARRGLWADPEPGR
jgi:micrococcal nuclease